MTSQLKASAHTITKCATNPTKNIVINFDSGTRSGNSLEKMFSISYLFRVTRTLTYPPDENVHECQIK